MYNPDNNNINKEKVKEIKSLLMNFIIMSWANLGNLINYFFIISDRLVLLQ
jgi:hypothetical protein